jgi:hypothetical protein
MAPVSYHEFFNGCASVAGALIGLLFVAISVSPAKLTGDEASIPHTVTAATAFSALVNALVIALVGLLPGGDIGSTAIALALVGLTSTTGLAFLLYRTRKGKVRLVQFVPLAVPLILYGLQLANGIWIDMAPYNVGRIDNQAVLSIIFFVFAIARAWRLVGVPDSDLVRALAQAWRAARSGDDSDGRLTDDHGASGPS